MMTDFKAIVYDCDGVLFESHSANLAYYNKIFSEFKCPLILDPLSPEAHVCHTASSPVVLSSFMPESDVAEALFFAQSIDYREFIPLMTEAAGLKDALQSLSQRFSLAVATNRGNSMQDLLEHFGLGEYFKVVVTSRDVEHPKPAPDMLLLAAGNLGVSPGECLFIGDSELDQRAAEAGGMPFIAYGTSIKIGQRIESHKELKTMLLESPLG